jgi:hypothetical protein
MSRDCTSVKKKLLRRRTADVATLALVGWYLMMPPHGTPPDSSLPPLSNWRVAESFDSANDCEDARGRQMAENIRGLHSADPAAYVKKLQRALDEVQCIEADDPRLKEK